MDDALKMKVFTDYALHRYYRAKADQWLAEYKKQQVIRTNEKG